MKLSKREAVAKLIRIVTVPPVMAAVLVIALWFEKSGVIQSGTEAVFSLLFLAVLPLLAYPLSAALPSLRMRGRNGQRSLAFALSVLGYICSWLYGALFIRRGTLMLIYGTYLFSVAILLLFNGLLKLRASGHACSVVGPMIMIVYFIGFGWALPCAAVYAASFWASVVSKRHTVKEYLLGSVSCVCAAAIAWCIYM